MSQDNSVLDDTIDGIGSDSSRDVSPDVSVPTDSSLQQCTLMESDCDMTDPTSCPPDEVCVIEEYDSVVRFVCKSPDGLMLAEGETCQASEECEPGLACVWSQGQDLGRCLSLCCAARGLNPCQQDAYCRHNVSLSNGSTSDWGVCEPTESCQLFNPDKACSDPEHACYLVDQNMGLEQCRRQGSRMVGESCQHQQDCASGLFCQGGIQPRCVRLCDLQGGDGDQGCALGETCEPFGAASLGVGICRSSR